MNKQVLIIGGTAVAGLAGGFELGYFFAKRHLAEGFAQQAAEEIAQAKIFYSRVYKKEDFATPEEAVEAVIGTAADALRAYQGKADALIADLDAADKVVLKGPDHPAPEKETIESITEVSEHDGTIEENVFDKEEPNLHDLLDVDNRNPAFPYVIAEEEFMANDVDHNQVTMTWYEGDGVLADEADSVVDDVAKTVGRMNLMSFGLGSGDENIVFIRNESSEMDYEITKSTGKYAHEVLGLEQELKHSEDRHRGKRRWDDDE